MKQAKRIAKPRAINWRLYVVLFVILVLFLAVFARAAYLQILNAEQLRSAGDMRSLRTKVHSVQRGMILDRNGEVLAASVPVYYIWVDPKIVLQNDNFRDLRLWQAFCDVIHEPFEDVKNTIVTNPKKRFIYVKRQLTKSVADYVKQLKISGVYSAQESKRYYPGGENIAQLIGVTNIDDKGIEGLEKKYDSWLSGTPTKENVRKAADGKVIEHLGVINKGVTPNNLVLSIDYRIQQLAYKAIKKSYIANQATSASIVVIDVTNGEVLAMATVPSYNPNAKDELQSYKMRNRAITDIYEPGSTVKPFVVAAALESKTTKYNDLIDTNPGWLRVGGKQVKDERNYGKISVAKILSKSSNVGVTKLSLSMPVNYVLDMFNRAGLGYYSGINLLGESPGILLGSDKKRWSEFEQATLSFGYGVMSSCLQLARMYSALGNGGVIYPSSIFKVDKKPEGVRVMSAKTADDVMHMLVGVLEVGGTAHSSYIDGYPVAGKTGTSKKAVAGGYGDDYVGLFAGIAPVNNPKLSIVVIVNDPKGKVYGGEVAAPAFKEVMSGALQMLNIEPISQKQQRALVDAAKDKYVIK